MPAAAIRTTMEGGWTMLVGKKLKEVVESQ